MKLNLKQTKSIFLLLMLVLLICGCTTKPESFPIKETVKPEATQVKATPTPLPGWETTYPGEGNSTANDIIQTSDGGYLWVGGYGSSITSYVSGGILLVKMSPNGDLEWEKTFGGAGYDAAWIIQPTNDDGYIIGGETTSFGSGGKDFYLIKVNEDGEKLWEKTYGSVKDESLVSILPAPNGGYFLAGNLVDPNDFITDPGAAGYAGFAGRSNPYFVRINRDGNLLWEKHLQSEDNMIIGSAAKNESAAYLVPATIIRYPDPNNALYLLKLNDAGDVIWEKTWEDNILSGYHINHTSEGNFLITGLYRETEDESNDILLMKIDGDGNTIWLNHYGENGYYESGHQVLETQSGQYVVLAPKTKSLYVWYSDTILYFIEPDGQLTETVTLDLSLHLKPAGMIQTKEGNFLLTGFTSQNGDKVRAYLIKTGPDGIIR